MSFDGMAEHRLKLEEEANTHIAKEMGTEDYDLAVQHMGGGKVGARKILTEAMNQLAELRQNGVRLRDGDGFVRAGLLNLTKLGLSTKQAEACTQKRRDHGIEAAFVTAKKLYGDYFEEAVERYGSSQAVAEKIYQSIEEFRNSPIPLRNEDNSLRLDIFQLHYLGLSKEHAEERMGQIQGMQESKVIASNGMGDTSGHDNVGKPGAQHFKPTGSHVARLEGSTGVGLYK